jgi:drug/metabolite transporter (DMT)-like permease
MVTWATHPCLGIVVRPNPVNHPSANTLAGIAYVVLSVACFAVLDTVTKNVSASMSLMLALWFRYLIQALFSTVFFLPKRGMALFKTDHPRFQLARGVLLFVSSMCAFYGLKYLPVGEFTAIASVTPLVVTLMAAMSLGEKVRKLRWALVLGAFAGTLVIVRPGSQHFDWVLIFPLLLILTNSSFQLLTRKMTSTEDPVTMNVLTGWVGTLLGALILPFVWELPTDWHLWLQLLIMGIFATVGHYLLIMAFSKAPATVLTPYFYTQIGFAMLGGWLMFDHVPDHWTLVGIGIVAMCGALGALLTVRESRIAVMPAES